MINLVMGILAHVDAGKTTLSESLLYNTGVIRQLGRVDKGDAFLDTDEMERQRGITIFSKQAVMDIDENTHITLLDTPGHIDFSPEAERCLWVLDIAILVVSGSDGVQGHTKTLFKLLRSYNIPTFIFVNKMDQPDTEPDKLLANLKKELGDGCINLLEKTPDIYEEIAMLDEDLMEKYLEGEVISDTDIWNMVHFGSLYPVYFGSALKNEGVDVLLSSIGEYAGYREKCDRTLAVDSAGEGADSANTISKKKGDKQSVGESVPRARVFKITRDEDGNRLTHMKITKGILKVRDNPFGEEKISRIRIYSGEKYREVTEASEGCVCAVLGLTDTYKGQGLGGEEDAPTPTLEAIMNYSIKAEEMDDAQLSKVLGILTEDLPEINAYWDEELRENHVSVMGPVQLEILEKLLQSRFNVKACFGPGKIVYKETISGATYGVGHFEPLRHYAEVHLKLEALPRGSGIVVDSNASVDVLALNWQRLIMTHVLEKSHRGVLYGAPLTDVKITVLTGRAHPKHTMGGDFRQATYRAIRHALMQANNVLLEPYLNFELRLPTEYVGRAMTDLGQKNADFEGPFSDENGFSILTGKAPAVIMQDYPPVVLSYTKGLGSISFSGAGYDVCTNAEEVIAQRGYDPEADVRNTPDSVFCYGGAGTVVPWHEVYEHMHLPKCLEIDSEGNAQEIFAPDEEELLQKASLAAKSSFLERQNALNNTFIGYEEVDAIVAQASGANAKSAKRENVPGWKRQEKRRITGYDERTAKNNNQKYREKSKPDREKYMLVDGYNVIHAWKELSILAADSLDGARGRLLDILCNYQAMSKINLIVVFDAYRVAGGQEHVMDYHNIHVVYTKEAETADAYIEKFAHENGKKYDITVVTSDGLEQIIITGEGCHLVSSREFEKEVGELESHIREMAPQDVSRGRFTDNLTEEGRAILESIGSGE